MANLLIGLAVGDIEKIRMNVAVEKLAIEVQMYLRTDSSLPKRLVSHFDKTFHRSYPNRQVYFIAKSWLRLSQRY